MATATATATEIAAPMSDRLTVILPPVLSAEEMAADVLEYISLGNGDGLGDSYGFVSSGDGKGDGYTYSYSFSWGGDGNGYGCVGTDGGDGGSTADIE
jgi:hypothetical protein